VNHGFVNLLSVPESTAFSQASGANPHAISQSGTFSVAEMALACFDAEDKLSR